MIRPINREQQINFGRVVYASKQSYVSKINRRIGRTIENDLNSIRYSDKYNRTLVHQLEDIGYDAIIYYENPNSATLRVTDDLFVDNDGSYRWSSSQKLQKYNVSDLGYVEGDAYIDVRTPVENFIQFDKFTNQAKKFIRGLFIVASIVAAGCLMKTCITKPTPLNVKSPTIQLVQKGSIK